MVVMVGGEADAAIQRPGGLVVVLDLEVEVSSALRDGPGREGRRDDGGEPVAVPDRTPQPCSARKRSAATAWGRPAG